MLKMVFRGYGQFEGELALGLENPLEYWGLVAGDQMVCVVG